MKPESGNDLSLFINVRNLAGLLFTSGLLHKFTMVKAKEVCRTEWTLHFKKIYPSHSKNRWVDYPPHFAKGMELEWGEGAIFPQKRREYCQSVI